MSLSWIKTASIYQVYPLSFAYAQGSKSDPHQGAYGNLKGVAAHVDHIASLGVDAVWLSPFFKSPLSVGFGYNVSDFREVGDSFGTMKDFDKMLEAFHAKGIKVIIDQVYNHTSDEHKWFQASKNPQHPEHAKYKDFYVWADAKGTEADDKPIPPNNWMTISPPPRSAWEWNEERKQFFLHTYEASMPDLNINNPEVRKELMATAQFWLDKGVDGFRLDAVSHYGHDPELQDNPVRGGQHDRQHDIYQPSGKELLRELKVMMEARQPKRIGTPPCAPYKPSVLAEMLYNDFIKDDAGHEAHAPVPVATHYEKEGLIDTAYTGVLYDGPKGFRDAVSYAMSHSPTVHNWAMSNHDMERAPTRFWGEGYSADDVKLYLSMIFSLPGSMCLYQGEELGLNNPPLDDILRKGEDRKKHDPLALAQTLDPRETSRAPMPWTKDDSDDAGKMWLKLPEYMRRISVETQNKQPDSVLNHVREMVKFRNATPTLKELGSVTFLDTPPADEPARPVIAFIKTSNETGKRMLCAFNFTDKEQTITLPQGNIVGVVAGLRGNDGRVTLKPKHELFASVTAKSQGFAAAAGDTTRNSHAL